MPEHSIKSLYLLGKGFCGWVSNEYASIAIRRVK